MRQALKQQLINSLQAAQPGYREAIASAPLLETSVRPSPAQPSQHDSAKLSLHAGRR